MRKIESQKLWRCLDANFNRAREGLRVCEDVCRFFWDDRAFTRETKLIRHRLTALITSLTPYLTVVQSRDIRRDVGQGTPDVELNRRDVMDIFWANAQRVKESIRVLEELAKLVRKDASVGFKKLRYRFYALEKKIVDKKAARKG